MSATRQADWAGAQGNKFISCTQVMVEGMGRLLVNGSPGNDFVDGAKPKATRQEIGPIWELKFVAPRKA